MDIRLALGSATLALAIASTPAFAQSTPTSPADTSSSNVDSSGDIVITAQRREQSLQDVPIAVTAVAGSQLTALGVRNVVDLSSEIPSLVVRNSDPTSVPMVFLRGVGSNDFNPNSSSPVSVYVDGVYVGSQAGQIGAYTDLSRIEVLRGPQGTLYGRNTTGGAINVISARPTQDLTGFFQIDGGRFDSIDATAAVSGALIRDVLAIRLSGNYQYSDGYAYNELSGNKLGGIRKADGRLSVLFTPSSALEIVGHVAWAQADSSTSFQPRGLIPRTAAATGADGLCAPAYYNTAACTDALGYSDTDKNPYSGKYYSDSPVASRDFRADLTATWQLGSMSLVSVTGYDYGRTREATDVTGGPDQILTAIYDARDRQFSQEIRLQSTGKKAFTWVVGAYYLHDNVVNNSAYDILRVLRPLFATPTNPSGVSPANSVGFFGYPSVQKTDSYAVFGQADWEIAPRLTLTGGFAGRGMTRRSTIRA